MKIFFEGLIWEIESSDLTWKSDFQRRSDFLSRSRPSLLGEPGLEPRGVLGRAPYNAVGWAWEAIAQEVRPLTEVGPPNWPSSWAWKAECT